MLSSSIKRLLEQVDREDRENLAAYISQLEHDLHHAKQNLKHQQLATANARHKDHISAEDRPTYAPSDSHSVLELGIPACIYNYRVSKLTRCNDAFLDYFSFPNQELNSKYFALLFPPVQPCGEVTLHLVVDARREVVKTGQSHSQPLRLLSIDGKQLYTEVSIIPCPTETDSVYILFRPINEHNEVSTSNPEQFQKLIELAPIGIARIDLNGKVAYTSIVAERILGYKRYEYWGMLASDLIHDEDRSFFMTQLLELSQKIVPVINAELRAIHKDGHTVWLEGSAVLLEMDNGERLGFLISYQDITSRKETEILLAEREATLNAVLNNVPNDIWVVNRNFEIVSINKSARHKLMEEFGLNGQLGVNILEEVENNYPEQLIFWKKIYGEALEGKTNTWLYTTPSHLKSKIAHREVSMGPYRTRSGKIIGSIGIMRDITQLRAQEKLVTEREAIYKALITSAREGVDILDVSEYHPIKNPTAKLIIRNQPMEWIYQSKTGLFITESEIEQLTHTLQPSGINSVELFRIVGKTLYKQGRSQQVFRFKHQENGYIDIEANEQILEVSDKKLLIRSYRDITNEVSQAKLIQQQLQQLNQQNDALQRYIESNMQLENFAYIASHDLRAPVRSIVSFSNLLVKRLEGKLTEEEQEFLQFIVGGATNMQALIEDLLTFSRANTTSGKMERVSFSELASIVNKDLSTTISEKNALLQWPKSEIILRADVIKLRQIMQNLIDNALKFAVADRQPIIKVTVKEETYEWIISVRDNGIGIDEQFQEQIFLIFKRLHTQDRYNGTGIGLALCKKLVEQHEGKIWVQSIVGKGSTFSFSISKRLNTIKG